MLGSEGPGALLQINVWLTKASKVAPVLPSAAALINFLFLLFFVLEALKENIILIIILYPKLPMCSGYLKGQVHTCNRQKYSVHNIVPSGPRQSRLIPRKGVRDLWS